MIRIISFLIVIALAALGVAWVAEQGGEVALSWGQWRAQTTLPVFALLLGIIVVAALLAWSILRGLWRAPRVLRHKRRAKRQARGRAAITRGLLAIGHGDAVSARSHADAARRLAGDDPLALLLHAQSAQMDGDRDGASRAFRAMAERKDTRLLGLRGLFIEAQRADDPHAAAALAEEALKTSPGAAWASEAVLGLRVAQNDWSAALSILERHFEAGQLDKATYRRQRGVLLTARALDLENSDRDVSRESVNEAIKLAPSLVPAAVLAARYLSESGQTRRAMRIIEAAWVAQPHPDLADAYAHVKLGDSARQRLVRVEALAAKAPDHIESALAIARAAIDASDFSRAREVLAPHLTAPTQRVAMLMAEIERSEHGDSGRARGWTQRAVRARHDPVWTADGYVSDVWRPVSPVTGRLDAFQWQTPLAALPSDSAIEAESDWLAEASRPEPRPIEPIAPPATEAPVVESPSVEPIIPSPSEPKTAVEAAPEPESKPVVVAPEPPPLFRARSQDAAAKTPTKPVTPIVPAVRAPDDPGLEETEDRLRDDYADELNPPVRQPGGMKGFLGRFGN
jgi:HemY protein